MNQIEYLLNHWISLQQSVTRNELKEFDAIVSQWHFTVSRQIKLKSLLLRWQALSTNSWLNVNQTSFDDSKDILQKLESDINSLEVHL